MSLASTVSSVIDVPATHNSGVDWTWPAWTAAISSSRDSNSDAASAGDERFTGLRDPAGSTTGRDHGDEHCDADGRRAPCAAGRRSHASTIPTTAFVAASRTMTVGDPTSGMSTNGMTRLPRMEPVVLTASSEPDSRPGLRAIVAEQRSGGRERQPEDDRDRQDDEEGRPREQPQGLERIARVEGLRLRRAPRQAEHRQPGDDHLADREDTDRISPVSTEAGCRSVPRWRVRSGTSRG